MEKKVKSGCALRYQELVLFIILPSPSPFLPKFPHAVFLSHTAILLWLTSSIEGEVKTYACATKKVLNVVYVDWLDRLHSYPREGACPG